MQPFPERELLDEFDEGPERRLRMDEGHRCPARAGTWGLVDHPTARILDRLERHRAVVDPVADMVETLTLVGQVFRDR